MVKYPVDSTKNKPGRPKGRHVGPSVRARLTPELYQAAQAAKRVLGLSLSDLIRLGVRNAVASACRRAAEIARSHERGGGSRLRALEFLQQARWAEFSRTLPIEVVEQIRRDAEDENSLCPSRRIRRSERLRSDPDLQSPGRKGLVQAGR